MTLALAAMRSRVDQSPIIFIVWGWRSHVLELALYIGAYFAYLLTRGLLFPDDRTALENANRIVALEQSLGIFWEPAWQEWAIGHARELVIALNWAYIVTYWPVILTMALVLYIINRRRYYFYRTVVALNLAFALLVFMLWPVASPFKTAYFIDTIQAFGPTYYGSEEMAAYYNPNAAMPSLHFSWTVILGVLLVRSVKGWTKALGLLYPVMTFFAITITGNHFILDAAAGGLLAAACFGLVGLGRLLDQRRHRAFSVRLRETATDYPATRNSATNPQRPLDTLPAESPEERADEEFTLPASVSDGRRSSRR